MEGGGDWVTGLFPFPVSVWTQKWRRETESKYQSALTTVNMAPKDAPKDQKQTNKKQDKLVVWLLSRVMN